MRLKQNFRIKKRFSDIPRTVILTSFRPAGSAFGAISISLISQIISVSSGTFTVIVNELSASARNSPISIVLGTSKKPSSEPNPETLPRTSTFSALAGKNDLIAQSVSPLSVSSARMFLIVTPGDFISITTPFFAQIVVLFPTTVSGFVITTGP